MQEFSSNGTYLAQWGSTRSGNGQFRFPLSVAAGANRTVYVVDGDNNRVQAFRHLAQPRLSDPWTLGTFGPAEPEGFGATVGP